MTPAEKFIIESNADYIAWIIDYYENEFKEYVDSRTLDEMTSDFEECRKKLNEIKEITTEKEQS